MARQSGTGIRYVICILLLSSQHNLPLVQIIRQGLLLMDEVTHGRAYGHGVGHQLLKHAFMSP